MARDLRRVTRVHYSAPPIARDYAHVHRRARRQVLLQRIERAGWRVLVAACAAAFLFLAWRVSAWVL